jgi:hypothetical protein
VMETMTMTQCLNELASLERLSVASNLLPLGLR